MKILERRVGIFACSLLSYISYISYMMTSILSEYVADPARFQRMCEFFLHARFRVVRPFIDKDGKGYEVFFTVEGELVDVRNRKRRFATFTDWFNAVRGTRHGLEYKGMFDAIYVTRRITLGRILETVTPKERAEFQDVKYLSSIAYEYIQRRMRSRFIDIKDKKQTLVVEWMGERYTISHINASCEKGSVVPFLHAMCGEETAIQGLYCVMADGSRVLLSEEAAVAVAPVALVAPVAPVAVAPVAPVVSEVTRKEFDDLKTHLDLLHTTVHSWMPEQQADHDTFTREIAELRAENQALATQCKNLTGLVGLLIQRVGCAGGLGFSVGAVTAVGAMGPGY